MAQERTAEFLAGVIEGFYGQPWKQSERFQLFEWMADWGLNTYVYAPKDDLKHRAIWRELYSEAEAKTLKELIDRCDERRLRFVYSISPGLDIRFADDSDLEQLKKRIEQMLALGCRHFALLFDDIPDRTRPEEMKRFGSLASAQSHITNALYCWALQRRPDVRFLFCPTAYCGRMAERQLGGEGYLATVGKELAQEIDVFWTGPEIISREITVAHVQELSRVLRRKPVIWDNLHANDYDGRRFFCGPYSGRPSELRGAVGGLLSNPNTEFPLNYVPLRTLAEFIRSDRKWEPREAYLSAMREWLNHFTTIHGPADIDDAVLFADSYYLPHEEGPEAEAMYRGIEKLLQRPPEEWGDEVVEKCRDRMRRLRDFCARTAELRDRELFYALSRRVWELREELELVERYFEFQVDATKRDQTFSSDFHLPLLYRGGIVARLQRLLTQNPDGTFTAAPPSQRSDPRTHRRTDAPSHGRTVAPSQCHIRSAKPGDKRGAYYVCLKTGNHGKDGESLFPEDPDALGRIYVGPYLEFEPELSLILEDEQGICGYALGAFDSRKFYERYENEWRPELCAQYPEPQGDSAQWTPVQHVHHLYHHPDYFCPEPYEHYPSHLHIDLLERARGRGFGRRMLEDVMDRLRARGSPGAHLGVSALNADAFGFYERLGFRELTRVGWGNGACIYMGKTL